MSSHQIKLSFHEQISRYEDKKKKTIRLLVNNKFLGNKLLENLLVGEE